MVTNAQLVAKVNASLVDIIGGQDAPGWLEWQKESETVVSIVLEELAKAAEVDAKRLWFMAFNPTAEGIETYFADFIAGWLRSLKGGE